ncbi:hypothetical protein ACF1BN_04390 [Streptomyces sp. NPDC014861]|uniref:hypothetical protein n=1 Tax=Streptomyces sp. NPDC014861 TaxID=3364923 RepID=UPI0036F773E8
MGNYRGESGPSFESDSPLCGIQESGREMESLRQEFLVASDQAARKRVVGSYGLTYDLFCHLDELHGLGLDAKGYRDLFDDDHDEG